MKMEISRSLLYIDKVMACWSVVSYEMPVFRCGFAEFSQGKCNILGEYISDASCRFKFLYG